MSAFFMGQRVRVRKDVSCTPWCAWALGRETTIECVGEYGYFGLALTTPDGASRIWARGEGLEPILDPRASIFVADMERFAKLAKERNTIRTLTPEELDRVRAA